MTAWKHTDHEYVTDPRTGRAISRACAHCGEARWVSRLKAALGLADKAPAQTREQAANAAEWAELNARQPVSAK